MSRPEPVEKSLRRQQAGADAERALAACGPELSAREAELLDEARQLCRAGALDGAAALAAIVRLTELDDLRTRLEHTVRQGRRATASLVPPRRDGTSG